ncbi:hypothetical protein VIGAN_02218300, partial [Vigna angularis var. angularis]
MQASKRMAEEAPSSSMLELLLLNFLVFPLLHSISFCHFCTFFFASSTLDTILYDNLLQLLYIFCMQLLLYRVLIQNCPWLSPLG